MTSPVGAQGDGKPRFNLRVECKLCEFDSGSVSGTDAKAIMARIDAAHDLLNPQCPDTLARQAASHE